MKLSIALITLNRQGQLIEALDSCVKCRLPKDTEFVIIDNASVDNTTECVEGFFSRNPFKYYYEKMSTNLGAGIGRNVAFSKCKGDYVYFMDDDAYVDVESNPDFFLKGIDMLDRHRSLMTLTTQIYDLAWQANRLSDSGPVIDESIRECYMLCGGSHFLRRAFFMDTNPYFPNQYGYEELQPSLRVADAGFLNGYTSAIRVIHNPKVDKWNFGNKKNKNILIAEIANQFAIKSSVYPRGVYLICKVAYILRKKRHLNSQYSKECDQKAKSLVRDYDFGKRIKLSTIFSLYLNFGFSIF